MIQSFERIYFRQKSIGFCLPELENQQLIFDDMGLLCITSKLKAKKVESNVVDHKQ